MSQAHLTWLRTYLENMYQNPILENFLGFEIVELADGKVVYRMQVIDKHCNKYGTVHGGTLASIADTVMGIVCVTKGKRVVTLDMSTSYIKNTSVGSILTAVGEVVSNGKTIVRTVCDIFHEEQLLVRSHGSFYVIGNFVEEDHP